MSGSPGALLVASDAKVRELTSKKWFGRSEELPVARLSPDEARARYRFDLGHPLDGAAYVANPCMPDHYLVPASANERMAQEKLAAFTQLAAALGAKKVELVSADEVGTEKGGGTPGISILGQKLGVSVSTDRKGSVTRSVYTELHQPTREPYVPDSCKPWIDMDPVLRGMVSARLHARPHLYSVELTVEDTLEIAGKLELSLAGKGIDLGGKVRTVGKSVWRFQIEFWPDVAPAAPAAEPPVFRAAADPSGPVGEAERVLAELTHPSPPFSIKMALAAGTGRVTRDIVIKKKLGRYKVGDAVTFTVTADVDCYLYVLNLGTSGKTTVLFPNAFRENNFLKGGEAYVLPGPDDGFDWELGGPPGIERIKAIATRQPVSLWELDFEGGNVVFRSFDATRVTRDIAVVRKKLGGIGPNDWTVTDTSFEVAP